MTVKRSLVKLDSGHSMAVCYMYSDRVVVVNCKCKFKVADETNRKTQ